MSEKKPFLVDVPVRVNIWIRPEAQRMQFEVLKKARPSIMFLISDGGRNDKEWEAIYQNRAIFDNEVDWDCKLYKVYEDKNNGLYTMAKKGADLIWSLVDRCIFLEDDYVPSVSFFAFCAELLEKYKDDERIQAICGMNHCGVWDECTSDYFFANDGAIWGMAYWKRSFLSRDPSHSYGKDPYVMRLLKDNTKDYKAIWSRIEGYARSEVFENHRAGGEFYHAFEIFAQNRLFIIPKYNMIKNVGCTANGTHAMEYELMPRGLRQIFNMVTYEYELPLKHPGYVIDDRRYVAKRNRIMAVGHPTVAFWRRIESFLLTLRYKGAGGIVKRIKKALNRRKHVEK